jgi:hypothetical protein
VQKFYSKREHGKTGDFPISATNSPSSSKWFLLSINHLTSLKTIWYQKLIITNFDKYRINDHGKLCLQYLRYPANIPHRPRPIYKKYPAYSANTPPVLIKNIPRLPGIFKRDTPPRRGN